jgi:hypothetical protein
VSDRWCRWCGDALGEGHGVERPAFIEMSCSPCFRKNRPTARQIAQIYGEFSLVDSTAQSTFQFVTAVS